MRSFARRTCSSRSASSRPTARRYPSARRTAAVPFGPAETGARRPMAVASDQPRLYAARAGTARWGFSVLKARGVAHRGPEPSWVPPSDWRRFDTLDAHAAGEPLRLVVSGVPPIPGATMVERRLYAREHLDDLRRALMFEPRGHADR